MVGLQLGDGSEVELHACGRCETQSWVQDGAPVPRDQVLATLRSTGGPSSRAKRTKHLP